MKRSKKYKAALAKIDRTQTYSLEDALKLISEISTTNFPGTVEVEVQLKLTDKQRKEAVRGTYTLPNRFGNDPKILVFADTGYKKSGSKADIVGGEELIKDVEAGKLSFDVVIATPTMMPKIAKLGKTLGVKGLMPNPKNGTVTAEPDKVIERFKSGMRNFRMDESGKINLVAGKTDMKFEELLANLQELFKQVTAELRKLSGNVIKKITLSPTMGPSIVLDVSSIPG